ncbi:MAG: hypothetical protein AAF399_13415, partial [Bacteroidota bacterium]
SGVNIKHTDCNGDGTINLLDIGAILLNYGETHNSNKTNTLEGIPMSLVLPSGLQAGDTISFPIAFGSLSMPAQNVYGVGFSISYDTSLVVPGSFEVEFMNSWLGNSRGRFDWLVQGIACARSVGCGCRSYQSTSDQRIRTNRRHHGGAG